MTATGSLLEILQAPGLTVERPLQLSGRWFTEVCLWLQSRIGALGAIGWPMVLIPEVVDKRFRLPEEVLQAYHRVSWSTEVPTVPFDVEATVQWVSARHGSVEIGLGSRAILDGATVARSLLVARAPGDTPSWGERDVPSVPATGTLVRRKSLIVSETEVRAFAELAGARYPVHLDARYAWQRGYPNILVQGMVLLIIQLHFAGIGPTGQAEMWFRRAVPAGSLLEVCRSDDDPAVWAIRLVSTGEVAAVARLT